VRRRHRAPPLPAARCAPPQPRLTPNLLSLTSPLSPPTRRRRGFDVYVNMVLEDVEETESTPEGGTRVTRLGQILLNGNNIAVLVPGGRPADAA
jgi:hypothetical protein